MKEYAAPEHAERENAPVRRRPSQKSAPAPFYEESEADSPLIRRAQRHKAEVTPRQFAVERAARQAEQGEPMSTPAPVSLPPTSTLARRLQERSGDAVAAALMRQFAAERAAREAEADAWPAPIPLRRRAAEADEPAGQVQRTETPTAALQRKDEDSIAEGAPLARLSAEVPAIPAGAATVPTVVERQDSAVARGHDGARATCCYRPRARVGVPSRVRARVGGPAGGTDGGPGRGAGERSRGAA